MTSHLSTGAMCLVERRGAADNLPMSPAQEFRLSAVSHTERTVNQMPPESTQQHAIQHTGTVEGVEVDDVGVVIDLTGGDDDIRVTFRHSADPLLAERAAELQPGNAVSVTAVPRHSPDGDLVLREGRGLST